MIEVEVDVCYSSGAVLDAVRDGQYALDGLWDDLSNGSGGLAELTVVDVVRSLNKLRRLGPRCACCRARISPMWRLAWRQVVTVDGRQRHVVTCCSEYCRDRARMDAS